MASRMQKAKSLWLQKRLHGICNIREIASALLLSLRSSMSNTKQQAMRAVWHGLHLHASNGGLPSRQLVLTHYNANCTAAPEVCWVRGSATRDVGARAKRKALLVCTCHSLFQIAAVSVQHSHQPSLPQPRAHEQCSLPLRLPHTIDRLYC